MRHWPRDQSSLVQIFCKQTRAAKMCPASLREMIGCARPREERLRGSLPRRLSRITMEITTSLGSHTVAACFPFVGCSVSTRTFDTTLYRWRVRRPYSLPFCLSTCLLRPLSSRFRVRPRGRRWKLAHVRANIREKASNINTSAYSFVLSEPRSRFSIFLNHEIIISSVTDIFVAPSATRSPQCVVFSFLYTKWSCI